MSDVPSENSQEERRLSMSSSHGDQEVENHSIRRLSVEQPSFNDNNDKTLSTETDLASLNTMKDLPYMMEDELLEFINLSELDLTKEEILYLKMRRRRMSIDENGHQNDDSKYANVPLAMSQDCKNSYPYKIVVIGDEFASDKNKVLDMFLGRASSSENSALGIQTKTIEIKKDKKAANNDSDNYSLELWLPGCAEENAFLRPLFYRATEAFVVVFSIKSEESYYYVRDVYLPELKAFIESCENATEKPLADFHRNTPILLVGNHAECRNDPDYQGSLLASEKVVALAQDSGACKYVEIFSDNVFHVHEIFHQAVVAIKSSHEDSPQSTEQRHIVHAKEDEYLRQMLTVPTPDGSFDQLGNSFKLECEDGIKYYFTLDGSEPTSSSMPYIDAIHVRKPYPQEIAVIGIGQGRYNSEIARFAVPLESEAPCGYFDIHTRTFRILTRPDTAYFVTLDGSNPDREKGIQYDADGDGVSLEDMSSSPSSSFTSTSKSSIPNACFSGQSCYHDVVKVIAIESNKFKSRVTSFAPYPVLPTPAVYYSNNERVLRVESVPGVLYKYTFDGTTPTWDSMTYTSPVLLPSDPSITNIKVAAFPKFTFPSRVVEVDNVDTVTVRTPRSESARHAVKMTNSAIVSRRAASPRSLAHYDAIGFNNSMDSTISSPGGRLIGFGSSVERGLSSRSPGRDRMSSSLSPQRRIDVSEGIRQQRKIQAPLTIKEQENLVHRKALFRRSSESQSPFRSRNSHEFRVSDNTSNDMGRKSADRTNDKLVQCKTDGTNVEFAFSDPVHLSNVQIKTPGSGMGPSGYECFVIDEENASVTRIGGGELNDVRGLQNLLIDLSTYKGEVRKLLCDFKMAPGQTSFKILDMKVDCKKI